MMAFGIDDTTDVRLSNGSVINQGESFLFLLNRIASLKTLSEHEEFWGRTNDVLSRMFNEMCNRLYLNFRHLIQNNLAYWQPSFDLFNRKIIARIAPSVPIGCALVFSFLDATVRPICNPGGGMLQRVLWNGKDRVHAIKFQGLNFPNGMVGDMPDCSPGRDHDELMVTSSGLNARIRAVQTTAVPPIPPPMHNIAYADKGYTNRSHVRAAHRGNNAQLLNWQRVENTKLKVPRAIGAEMPFGQIIQQSKFLSYKKGLKVQMMAVNQIYIVAVLLSNAHTCLYGSNVGEYFDCAAPKLYDYMHCAARGIPFFDA